MAHIGALTQTTDSRLLPGVGKYEAVQASGEFACYNSENPFNALDHQDTLLRSPYGCKPLAENPTVYEIMSDPSKTPEEKEEARLALVDFNTCNRNFDREWKNLQPVCFACFRMICLVRPIS